MTTTDMTAEAASPMRNGVDTATLFATLDAVRQAPEAARFQFRARNQWVSGTHNRTTIGDYFGVGGKSARTRPPSSSTPTTPPSWSAPTAGRPRPSSCCTRWPPA